MSRHIDSDFEGGVVHQYIEGRYVGRAGSPEMPRVNGCICDVCAESGIECRDIAMTGEDQCLACRHGIHWASRR